MIWFDVFVNHNHPAFPIWSVAQRIPAASDPFPVSILRLELVVDADFFSNPFTKKGFSESMGEEDGGLIVFVSFN